MNDRPVYSSVITLEIEIEHFGTPQQTAEYVRHLVSPGQVPAITDVKIMGVLSNYRLFEEPNETLVPVDFSS